MIDIKVTKDVNLEIDKLKIWNNYLLFNNLDIVLEKFNKIID
jgi:hypothetical protein